EVLGPGRRRTVNRHVETDRSDWQASIDELVRVCPNLESVALVVTWYGNDLRAGHCTLKPAVTTRSRVTVPDPWGVAGLGRADARLVSTYEGEPAYGGTPSDASVMRAIADLKARGLEVMLYPFVMMDIPAGNGRPDPYGGAEQAAHPWRGMLTASVAPGRPGTPDKTATAASQVADFVGTASRDDFTVGDNGVVYSGPDEWSYRRFILHYAKLAKGAGGVDAFLVGSELRGLTTLRSGAATYPFVNALVAIAAEVSAVLPAAKVSYAADWSEYAGHRPDDGSGDVYFHLDPLWASNDIDFVGIDNYLPLADWRDGSGHLDADLFDNGRSVEYLRANIAGGEHFDWYYASDADRAAQVRTPITDGAYGKPWVHRAKDLAGWWGNAHHDRPGGVESGAPTAWVPESKPIRFTELGCPAVDKGANQPNVFPDPKSSASARPWFSSGLRDDVIQRRFLEAVAAHFDPDDPSYAGGNPVSSLDGRRMVDADRIHVWTWDARPFPAFPLRTAVWSDGPNYRAGHWLNGRLGAAPADGLVAAILADFGVADVAVGELDGAIDGYVVDGIGS
nr:glycoside hydrolase TIM-barrel-like domain-containing protein [Bauldia sp.]